MFWNKILKKQITKEIIKDRKFKTQIQMILEIDELEFKIQELERKIKLLKK